MGRGGGGNGGLVASAVSTTTLSLLMTFSDWLKVRTVVGINRKVNSVLGRKSEIIPGKRKKK